MEKDIRRKFADKENQKFKAVQKVLSFEEEIYSKMDLNKAPVQMISA